MFSFFINDLPKVIYFAKALLFADDLKLYIEINKKCPRLNHFELKQDLLRVTVWCKNNGLILNSKKCFTITFSRQCSDYLFDYDIFGETLSRVNSIRDLGVIMDSKLNFQEHIDTVYSEASKNMYFIIRNTKSFKNTKCIRTLYMSLVRSKLTYGSQIWRPLYFYNMNYISKIQNRVLRHLAYVDHNPMHRFSHDYSQTSKKFNIPTLKSVMDLNDVKTMIKICNLKLECGSIINDLPWDARDPQMVTRSINLPFYLNVNSAKYLDNDPIYRMCKLTNMISSIDANLDFNMILSMNDYSLDKFLKKSLLQFN